MYRKNLKLIYMKEYLIKVTQKIEYEATVYIEAKTKEQAMKIAKEMYEESVTVSEMEESCVGDVYEKKYNHG